MAVDMNRFDEFETRLKRFENWVAKQCLPVEAAVATVTGAVSGVITGVVVDVAIEGFCSAFSIQLPSSLDSEELTRLGGYRPLIQSFAVGPTLEQARNFAVMYGVNSGISCVMKKLRGKDDVETSMAAAFGSGVVLSLVTAYGYEGPECNICWCYVCSRERWDF